MVYSRERSLRSTCYIEENSLDCHYTSGVRSFYRPQQSNFPFRCTLCHAWHVPDYFTQSPTIGRPVKYAHIHVLINTRRIQRLGRLISKVVSASDGKPSGQNTGITVIQCDRLRLAEATVYLRRKSDTRKTSSSFLYSRLVNLKNERRTNLDSRPIIRFTVKVVYNCTYMTSWTSWIHID